MKKQTLLYILLAIAVAIVATAVFNTFNNSPTSLEIHTDEMNHDHSDETHSHMDMMHDMTVDSERAFIVHMIPHHQEAVDTAREVLLRGGTTLEIRELMNSIISSQTEEIESMKKWYVEWYGEEYMYGGTYEPMMRELEELSGATLDRVFLEDMIVHHMGAIMMARSVLPYIEHEEIRTLTEDIIVNQSNEIRDMRIMLQSL